MSNRVNDVAEGFKMTELGLLPEEWKTAKLFEVTPKKKFAIVDGPFGSQMKVNEFTSSGIPVVEMEQLKENNFNAKFRRFISEQKYDEIKRSTVIAGDLIISKTGTLGLVGIVPPTVGKAVMTSRLSKVSIDDSLAHTKFVYFALLFLREVGFWDSIGEGTTMKVLTIRKIGDALIPLPPLPEQKAIARVLSTTQKAIEAQDKTIAAAREMKKSLMRHLFTYGPVPVAEAEQVPLKETEIGPVPEQWDVVRLGEITDKPEYGYTASASSEIIGPKLLRITDIQNGGVDWVSVPYCECSPVEEGKYRLQPGDILFARIGATTGKTYLTVDCPPAVFASYLIRVRCKSSLMPDYLSQFTTTQSYWNQINASKGGRLKQGINIPVLKSLLVPFPSLPEQLEIARMLSAIDEKTEAEEDRKTALQALFKTMLHLLMTGKLRVKDLEVSTS